MMTVTKIIGSMLLLPVLLFTACTTRQDSSSAPESVRLQPTTRLSREQAVALANAEAVKQGRDVNRYELRTAEYEFSGQDHIWTVFFEGKVKATGNHFLVWVNDQTDECRLMPGE
jgi:hypothetical protein